MVALKLVVLNLLKFIQIFFSALSGLFDFMRTKEDQKSGANKVKVAQYEKRDEIRKGSDAIWNKPDRDRLQRNKGKSRK